MSDSETTGTGNWGITLRTWRRQNNIKQSVLAQQLGVSQPAIARWESGRDIPSPAHQRRLRDLMAASTNSELALQKLFTSRQSAVRALYDFDDVSTVETSAGFRDLWPETAATLGVPLRDMLVNEAFIICNDTRFREQILNGSVGLVSGVSTRQLSLQLDAAVRHQWHVCFRRFGSRLYADMVYEPCSQDLSPGIKETVRFDELI